MSDFDPTESSVVRKTIREMLTLPARGTVTKVWPHTSQSDESNHEVNVDLYAREQEHRRVPVSVPTGNVATVPSVGDEVLVEYLGGDGTRPIVTRVVYTDENRAPLGREGDVRLRRGDLEVELAGDGSTARLAQRSDPTADPDLVVEVDQSGQIRLGAPGETLKPVARKGDAVSGTTSDGATFSGTIDEGSEDVSSS